MAPEIGNVVRRVPVVLRWLLRTLAPAGESRALLADLEEEAAAIAAASGWRTARRWIWWQSLHSLRPLAAGRARRARVSMRTAMITAVSGWGTDVKHVVRRLRRSPGFTCVAVLMLVLSIGATSAIFSLAYAIWLAPLPYRSPDRLVSLAYMRTDSDATAGLSGPDIADYRVGTHTFEGIAAYGYGAQITRAAGEPVRVVAYRVTTNLFDVLGTRPVIGRTFVSDDEHAPVVVLSHDTWVRWYGADPDVLGRSVTLTGVSYRIVGVMPAGFRFPRGLGSDVWLPTTFAGWTDRSTRYLQAIGRLRPGIALAEADRDVKAVSRRLAEAYPSTNAGWSAGVVPLDRRSVWYSRAFGALLGMVGLFLLAACANLAGLLVARNLHRRGEFAVCASLGASRARLARQSVVEALLLATAGGAGGTMLSAGASRALATVMPSYLPGLADVHLSLPVLLFSVGVAIVTAAVCGLLPAISVRGVSASQALTGARGSGPRSSGLQSTLVVAEIAAAMTLVVGASLMAHSFANLVGRDRGFDPHGVLALDVTLPAANDRYDDPGARAAAIDRILETVERVPGVTRAGATNGFPGSSLGVLGGVLLTPTPAGRPTRVPAALHAASPGYFQAMGAALHAGRAFDDHDTAGSPPVAIINDTLARAIFGDQPAVGRPLVLPASAGEDRQVRTVVGVVGDMHLDETTTADVFVPVSQRPAYWVDLVVRTQGDPRTLETPVRRALRALDPDLLIENSKTIDAIVSDDLGLERAQSVLSATVALLAAAVAGVGLYALIAFVVAQQTREIGIRLALGSSPRALSWWFVRRGLGLVVAGVTIGGLAMLALVRWLGTLVFGLASSTASAYVASAGLLLVIGLVAVWAPARRVLRADPVVAMRSD